MRAARYDGTPVVILNPTDIPVLAAFTQVTADNLRKIGMRVEVQNMDWATLLKRCFAVDCLECARCHSRMQRIALITKPDAIRKILSSVGLPADSPRPAPSRWLVQQELFDAA